jgi:hypothetical protein
MSEAFVPFRSAHSTKGYLTLDTAMKQQPSNNPGGGGGNPGGGGGNPGGNPGAPNPPAAPPMPPANQDARLMGSTPTEFDGDRAKADQFINEL